MDKHICAACDGRGFVAELPPAPAVQRDLSMDYRDIACRTLDKAELHGRQGRPLPPDEIEAMTARIAELDGTDLFDHVDSPESPRAETVNVAERIQIERDNLQGARDWAMKRLYPYLLREAGPLPLPLERIAELAAQKIERLGYIVSVSVTPPLCPSCGRIREHMPCTESGTLTGCFDRFHSEQNSAVTESKGG